MEKFEAQDFILRDKVIENAIPGDITFPLAEDDILTKVEVFDDHLIVESKSGRKWKIIRCMKRGCVWWRKEFI